MHIVHVVYRFGIGGLENGLVKIVTNLPQHQHTIITLTDADPVQQQRVAAVAQVVCLQKPPGQGFRVLRQIFSLLRHLHPDVVHTRNIGTLDVQFLAFIAGVRGRVHSEHGWDTYDPEGKNPRYRWLRRFSNLYVQRWIGLSEELCTWLVQQIRIHDRKVTRIINGVDTTAIRPCHNPVDPDAPRFVTVSRLSEIKNPLNTVNAFLLFCEHFPDAELTVVGDGPLFNQLESVVAASPYRQQVKLVGEQSNVTPYLQAADVFLLGSSKEGISNTILEAMAAGLPVIATEVGGNAELVEEGTTGYLVRPDTPVALCQAMLKMSKNPQLRERFSLEARLRAERQFSIQRMVDAYQDAYAGVARI